MNTSAQPAGVSTQWRLAVRTFFRGIGQVMFQQSSWTGFFFLAGIFWGSYACHLPQVAWGAAVGTVASTIAGYLVGQPAADGDDGLWGFNGVLVGCAFPTFLANTWIMWVALVFFAMLTTWVRTGYNNVMAPWKVNSLTFPFVTMTWVMLLASRIFEAFPTFAGGLSAPEVTQVATGPWSLDMSFGNLVIYWLKGIAQVFLISSWVTGALFLVGLWLCSRWAAFWAAVGSAVSLALAILFEANPSDISSGLFGFSPVLTAIALGCTFYAFSLRSAIWTLAGIVATVFVQGAMDVLFEPWGIPTLTGPFCITTWLFLLPLYKFNGPDVADHSLWTAKARKVSSSIDTALDREADKL